MNFPRLTSFKSVDAFREHLTATGLELPCDPVVLTGPASPLAAPLSGTTLNGKTPGNRWVIHPMEGWDGTLDGRPTDDVFRRWRRFGTSGAKTIFGGEAMAVRPDGRANPRQLILQAEHTGEFAALRQALVAAHKERYGPTHDLVIGFQLTHSGRFCRPEEGKGLAPRVAYRHPLLDARFGVTSDNQVFTDAELDELLRDYVRAARVARDAGADFVDLKHCHGYLLHELLSAHTRPGRYGGSFDNRTRFLRDLVAAIRADGNDIDFAVRLSAFDFVPFHPDPAQSAPGRPGPGVPMEHAHLIPYRYGFGLNPHQPLEPDLEEPLRFLEVCAGLGIKLLNLSAGSPYYNPHIQRPAAYPPSDGYQPPEDPLAGVARQMQVTRELRRRLLESAAPRPLPAIIGTGYTYLQEYLPHVAQAAISQGWTDAVGLGRMVLSYPELPADVLAHGRLEPKMICRTFSDCTTAPRNGMVSGCYPLDDAYRGRPEARRLREIKRAAAGR